MLQRTSTKNATMFQLSMNNEYIHITSLVILYLLFSGSSTHMCCKRSCISSTEGVFNKSSTVCL